MVHKTLLAGLWFAVFAFLSVSLLFHGLPMAPRGLALYIALPTAAGAIAGGFWGRTILDPGKITSVRQSLIRGVLVGVAAFVIFAALFALTLPLVEQGWSFRQSGGLFVLTSTLGVFLALPVILFGGMLAAVSLYLFRRRVLAGNRNSDWLA